MISKDVRASYTQKGSLVLPALKRSELLRSLILRIQGGVSFEGLFSGCGALLL